MIEEKKEPLFTSDLNSEASENQQVSSSTSSEEVHTDTPAPSADVPPSSSEKETELSWFEQLFQSDPSKLKQQMDELTAKNEELKDKYLRLFADFDNYKKRMAKERLELIDNAGKEFFKLILPVVDDFERALKAFETTNNQSALKEGVELVYQKLIKTLESKGVKAMDSNGKEFNAEWHEAISEIEAPSEELKGKVIETVEKGYLLHERIIRHAKVVVGK